MMFFGSTTHGIYKDDCEGIHPDVINQYYGIHGRLTERTPGQTGAGHSGDEAGGEANEWEDIEERVGDDQQANIRHDAIEVPDTADPFGVPGMRQVFEEAFSSVVEHGLLPVGYGILQEEMEGGVYPLVEVIRLGR